MRFSIKFGNLFSLILIVFLVFPLSSTHPLPLFFSTLSLSHSCEVGKPITRLQVETEMREGVCCANCEEYRFNKDFVMVNKVLFRVKKPAGPKTRKGCTQKLSDTESERVSFFCCKISVSKLINTLVSKNAESALSLVWNRLWPYCLHRITLTIFLESDFLE